MTRCTTPRRRARPNTRRPLDVLDPNAEQLAIEVADQLDAHPDGNDAAIQLDRLATVSAARSAADAHLARVLRRALDIHRRRRNSNAPRENNP